MAFSKKRSSKGVRRGGMPKVSGMDGMIGSLPPGGPSMGGSEMMAPGATMAPSSPMPDPTSGPMAGPGPATPAPFKRGGRVC